ncbi:MAG: hypothetical protein ACO25B_10495 [Chitinophagaceae bacterium]
MKKIWILGLALTSLVACGSKDKKETATSIAQQWCDLNAKVAQATDDDTKNAAKKARSAFEDKMQEKYKDNQAFLDEIGKEVEKCEDASEGK